MKREDWWKNFGLGLELDASGVFIYNGIKTLHLLENISQSIDIFEILYNLSVGIERLHKVAIILLEHTDKTTIEELEKSLITHDTMGLSNRISKHKDMDLAGVHKEFLSILSKFYKCYRYGRYSVSAVPDIETEKEMFHKYLSKHLGVDVDETKSIFPVLNTDQIRKFVGKITKKIVNGLYIIICERTNELNIYTHELRYGSKAAKVFLGDRLDFIEESIVKREMLLYLMHPLAEGDHINFLRKLEPLTLDPGLAPGYIKALLNDTPEAYDYVAGEVEAQFEKISNARERMSMLEIMDNENILFSDDEEP